MNKYLQTTPATPGQSVVAGMLDMGLNYGFRRGLSSQVLCKIHTDMRVGFSQCDVEPEIQLLYPAGVGVHELLL